MVSGRFFTLVDWGCEMITTTIRTDGIVEVSCHHVRSTSVGDFRRTAEKFVTVTACADDLGVPSANYRHKVHLYMDTNTAKELFVQLAHVFAHPLCVSAFCDYINCQTGCNTPRCKGPYS